MAGCGSVWHDSWRPGPESPRRESRSEVLAQAAQGPPVRSSCAHYRQTGQLCCCQVGASAGRGASAAETAQQSGRELAPTDTTTRADDATVQITRANPTLPLRLRSHFFAFSTTTAYPSSCELSTGNEATLCDLGRGHWSSISGFAR